MKSHFYYYVKYLNMLNNENIFMNYYSFQTPVLFHIELTLEKMLITKKTYLYIRVL